MENGKWLVSAARELRDRWLEHVNAGAGEGEGVALEAQGKYEVSRQLERAPRREDPPFLLPAQAA